MQIVSLLKEHGKDLDTPVILGGDFNSLWGKSKPDLFDQVGFWLISTSSQNDKAGDRLPQLEPLASLLCTSLQVPPGECLVSRVCELLTKGVVTRTHHDHLASRRGAADVPDFTSHGLVFKSSYNLVHGRCCLFCQCPFQKVPHGF